MLFRKYSLNIIGLGIINYIPNGTQYAFDIGGTLIKLVYIINLSIDNLLDSEENLLKKNFKDIKLLKNNGDKVFFCVLTSINKSIEFQIKNIFGFLNERGIYRTNIVPMTGGGSLKYKSIIESEYKVEIVHYDEIQSIVNGYTALIENSLKHNQTTHYYCISEEETILVKMDSNIAIFPTLIISIGSGVSIIRVESNYKFERVSGTRFGGGTVFGISKLFGVKDFCEFIDLCSNFEKKNKIVKNNQCFFKEFLNDNQIKNDIEFKENIVYNIVNMMYCDLSYLICLILSKYKSHNIVFCGNYVSNHHKIIINSIKKYSYLVNNKINVFFHYLDGFFGAIGAYFSHKNV